MLRFASGVLAWVRSRAMSAREKDTSLVDWLESRRGDSPVVLRWSSTGRGWRLHDWSGGPASGIFLGGPCGTVREAIREAMNGAAAGRFSAALEFDVAGSDGLASEEVTDSQMLDWLDRLSGRYTGRVIWRRSTTGSGWRLHETSRSGAVRSVREAVSDAIRLGK